MFSTSRLWPKSIILLAVFCGISGVHAQTFRGAISGIVSDASGAIIPNANVALTNAGTAIEMNTVTTSGGEFSFQDLAPGAYSVKVSAAGFTNSSGAAPDGGCAVDQLCYAGSCATGCRSMPIWRRWIAPASPARC